jgi:hypothetical protein
MVSFKENNCIFQAAGKYISKSSYHEIKCSPDDEAESKYMETFILENHRYHGLKITFMIKISAAIHNPTASIVPANK